MTVPHPLQQLGLFAAQWYQPVDTRSQVDRMPGTADAPCACGRERCRWPFDPDCWPNHHPDKEDE